MAEELLMSDSTVKASEKHFVFFFFACFFFIIYFRFKNFLLVIRCPLAFFFSIGKAHFRIII